MPTYVSYTSRYTQTKKDEKEDKKEKLCPMAGVEDEPTCVENECAWWLEEEKACALVVIAKSLSKIANKGEK